MTVDAGVGEGDREYLSVLQKQARRMQELVRR
jgi:hypothetical protein